ncbi:hypothetical protein PHMEG_00035154 [Phytophthora megakarya]|uniref:Uncharacterized protein n=1 Tax=Phytophthora megakarya TaxID=4795 RepID=A0A225UPL4_9STRA|nr:hypothetical protein PHMEG_00035154 [Phytophthora megakarya]
MVKEAKFKSAVDWLAATDQDVEDGISLRTSILQRCIEYYEPFDTMHSPLAREPKFSIPTTNLDTESDGSSSSDESDDRPMGNVDHDTIKQAQLDQNHGFHLADMSVLKLKLSLREKEFCS